ncbi:MAG: 50S ribosomal protein L11 methyltransferase [Oscillospiraceae bacterium]|nr:50S ribosomal protein L11 methyltransferase [Oscillospiraceae bacterium]
MEYWKITLPAAPDTLDALTARLTALGFDSFQIEDERDVLAQSPHWEMTDGALLAHYKGACRVLVYLPRSPEGEAGLTALRGLCPEAAAERVREEDWAENWKRYYEPIPVGRRLVIHPAWLPRPDYGPRAVYLSNPGCCFGTGLHASTRLCLGLLEARDVTGARVLDIGAGSGILGVCALLLGAAEAVAADIDPLASDTASRAAEANGAAGRYTALTGDFVKEEALRERAGSGFDLIFSNIVADVILALAPHTAARLAPGGAWVVSGIIDGRAAEVREGLEAQGFRVETAREENGWAAFSLVQPADRAAR